MLRYFSTLTMWSAHSLSWFNIASMSEPINSTKWHVGVLHRLINKHCHHNCKAGSRTVTGEAAKVHFSPWMEEVNGRRGKVMFVLMSGCKRRHVNHWTQNSRRQTVSIPRHFCLILVFLNSLTLLVPWYQSHESPLEICQQSCDHYTDQWLNESWLVLTCGKNKTTTSPQTGS